MKLIDAPELAQWLADATRPQPVLLDVRELPETQECRIKGSLHIRKHAVPVRLNELEKDRPIVSICHHGARGKQVALFLLQQGYHEVYNLSGGIHAWATQVDLTMDTY
jgi:rhodanese-related sulfurtransferase